MSWAQLDRRSVPDQVFSVLCEEILTNRYQPGEKLPTQRQLASDFSVNIASVREAIMRLQQLGLVEVRQGDSTRVNDWRKNGGLDVIAHALLRAGTLDQEVLINVLEARTVLLTESARMAASRRSGEQATRLCSLAERMQSEADDAAAQSIDFAFMEEMIEASGNLVFVLIMNSIRELYLQGAVMFRAIVAARQELVPYYWQIAIAIADETPDEAAAAALTLADRQMQQILGLLKA